MAEMFFHTFSNECAVIAAINSMLEKLNTHNQWHHMHLQWPNHLLLKVY